MRRTARTSTLERIFGLGIQLFNTVNDTFENVRDVIGCLTSLKDTNKIQQPKWTKEQFTKAAYHYMELQPGCGKKAVQDKFRVMVKQLRPDINLDDLTKNRFIALEEARKLLFGIEMDLPEIPKDE